MREFLISLFLLFSVNTAALEYGRLLEPRVWSDGQTAFGMQYAYDADLNWVLTFTSNLSASEIQSLPSTLYWSVVDSKRNLFVKWNEVPKDNILVGTFEIEKRLLCSHFSQR